MYPLQGIGLIRLPLTQGDYPGLVYEALSGQKKYPVNLSRGDEFSPPTICMRPFLRIPEMSNSGSPPAKPGGYPRLIMHSMQACSTSGNMPIFPPSRMRSTGRSRARPPLRVSLGSSRQNADVIPGCLVVCFGNWGNPVAARQFAGAFSTHIHER